MFPLVKRVGLTGLEPVTFALSGPPGTPAASTSTLHDVHRCPPMSRVVDGHRYTVRYSEPASPERRPRRQMGTSRFASHRRRSHLALSPEVPDSACQRLMTIREPARVNAEDSLNPVEVFWASFRTFLSPGGVRELPPGCGGYPVRGATCARCGVLGTSSSGSCFGGCRRVPCGRACSGSRRFISDPTRRLACLPHAVWLRCPSSLPRR